MTLTKGTSLQTLGISAVAIGPNMLPSTTMRATVSVSPYPVLSVACDKASVTKNGGAATFTISASGVAASPVTENNDDVDDTVTLTVEPDTASPQTYMVGVPSAATLILLNSAAPAGAPSTPVSSTGAFINEAQRSAGFSLTVGGLSAAGAEAGYTLTLLMDGSPLVSHTLTAGEVTSGFAFSIGAATSLGADGSKSFSARIVDAAGNVGPASSGLAVTLDTTPPSGYSATIAAPYVIAANVVSVPISFSGAEVGDSYSCSVTSSGGGSPVSDSGTVTSSSQILTCNLTGLADGTLTTSLTLTDPAGNAGGAATTTTIKDTTALPAPVGEYLFNGDFSDASGGGHTGASLGGTGFAADRHGVAAAALSVSQNSGPNVDLGTSFQFTNTSSFSVSIWFYALSYGGANWPGLVSQGGIQTGEFTYGLNLNGGAGLVQSQVSSNNELSFGPSSSFTINTWHHLVLVYDGGAQTVSGYLDGLSFGTNSAAYSYAYSHATGHLYLGGGNGLPDFTGCLDDLIIYGSALSAAQVLELFSLP